LQQIDVLKTNLISLSIEVSYASRQTTDELEHYWRINKEEYFTTSLPAQSLVAL